MNLCGWYAGWRIVEIPAVAPIVHVIQQVDEEFRVDWEAQKRRSWGKELLDSILSDVMNEFTQRRLHDNLRELFIGHPDANAAEIRHLNEMPSNVTKEASNDPQSVERPSSTI
jgi:hypothetical protein